jgi:hypothetical protein
MKLQTQEALRDAIRYWEPRRIIFNLVLATVVVGWVALTWPHFQAASPLQGLLFLVFASGAMNLCYTAVYLADIPLQHSEFRLLWQRFRWSLWLVGMLFALLLENYWIADEIYPYVR